jgi:hypothetical protein
MSFVARERSVRVSLMSVSRPSQGYGQVLKGRRQRCACKVSRVDSQAAGGGAGRARPLVCWCRATHSRLGFFRSVFYAGMSAKDLDKDAASKDIHGGDKRKREDDPASMPLPKVCSPMPPAPRLPRAPHLTCDEWRSVRRDTCVSGCWHLPGLLVL